MLARLKWAVPILLILNSAALAAEDAASRRVAEAHQVASIDWSGLYLGAGVGYLGTSGTARDSGASAGIFAGYNWQFGQGVAGIEGSMLGAGVNVAPSQTLPVLLDFRGRIGVGVDDFLIYGTAGGAWVPPQSGKSSAGGIATGAGVDWAASEHMIWGLQYLHYKFENFRNTGHTLDVDLVKGQVSWHF